MNGERRLTGRPGVPRPPVFSATSAAVSSASWIRPSPGPRPLPASSPWVRTCSCVRISADSGAWGLFPRCRLPGTGPFKPLSGLRGRSGRELLGGGLLAVPAPADVYSICPDYLTRCHLDFTNGLMTTAPGWAGQPDRGLFSISVAAELAGLHPQTLRIYEREGLLDPARTIGGTRRHSTNDIDRLTENVTLTAGGLNLAGVRLVLELQEQTRQLQAEIDDLRRQLEG